MNHIFLKMAHLNIMQSHPLHRRCFGQYQLCICVLTYNRLQMGSAPYMFTTLSNVYALTHEQCLLLAACKLLLQDKQLTFIYMYINSSVFFQLATKMAVNCALKQSGPFAHYAQVYASSNFVYYACIILSIIETVELNELKHYNIGAF